MTDTTAPSAVEHEAHWTRSARDAVDTVLDARPDLNGAEFAILVEVAELITAADELMEAARASSLTSTGSKGQLTASPLVVEARLSRAEAGSLLTKLTPPRPAAGSRGGSGRYVRRLGGVA